MKAVICDIDGVILRDETPLPGAQELLRALTGRSAPFLFLTNYPSQTPEELRARLAQAGLEVGGIAARHFYTSALATAEFLHDQAGERRRAYVVGEGALVQALTEAGFTITDEEADYVVLGRRRSTAST